jgi:hypothetical protein
MVVGHPDAPGRMLVAVLTDDEAYVAEPSVRVRDRLMADRLERLGWTVVRVWSAAAFLDPEAEVDRIRRAVHACVPKPVEPRTGTAVIGLPPSWTDDEPAAEAIARVAAALAELPDEPVPAERPAPEAAQAVQAAQAAQAAQDDDETASAAEDDDETVPAAEDDAQPPSRPLSVVHVEQPLLPVRTGPRPDVRRGLPIAAYSDDQLDDLVAWLRSDGEERSRDELAAALREELGVTRRSFRIDTAVRAAITRALS